MSNYSSISGEPHSDGADSNISALTGQTGANVGAGADTHLAPSPGGMLSGGLLTPEQSQSFDMLLKWGGLIGLIFIGVRLISGARY